MPSIRIDPSFGKRLKKKEAALQAAILETVKRLGDDSGHPGLHTHPIQGTKRPKVFDHDIINRA